MKSRRSYTEKLKDPRWQRKRLEIMDRDQFTCQLCDDKESTLHVHHLKYEDGKEPWEYDSDMLVTVCETCHGLETFERKEIENALIEGLKSKGYNMSDLINLWQHLPKKKIGDETVVIKIIRLFSKPVKENEFS